MSDQPCCGSFGVGVRELKNLSRLKEDQTALRGIRSAIDGEADDNHGESSIP